MYLSDGALSKILPQLHVMRMDSKAVTGRLRPQLHSGDGLHLNREAYRILDRLVAPLLEDLFPGPPDRGALSPSGRAGGSESSTMKRVPDPRRSPR